MVAEPPSAREIVNNSDADVAETGSLVGIPSCVGLEAGFAEDWASERTDRAFIPPGDPGDWSAGLVVCDGKIVASFPDATGLLGFGFGEGRPSSSVPSFCDWTFPTPSGCWADLLVSGDEGFSADPRLCVGGSVLEDTWAWDIKVMGARVGFGEEAGTAVVIDIESALERVGFAIESTGVKATVQELISFGTTSCKPNNTHLEDRKRH
jgi:hypothetical protein